MLRGDGEADLDRALITDADGAADGRGAAANGHDRGRPDQQGSADLNLTKGGTKLGKDSHLSIRPKECLPPTHTHSPFLVQTDLSNEPCAVDVASAYRGKERDVHPVLPKLVSVF